MSNAVFDTSLREQDAEWGVRDIADIEKLAAGVGLALIEKLPMPANNMILVFGRSNCRRSVFPRVNGRRGTTPVREASSALRRRPRLDTIV